MCVAGYAMIALLPWYFLPIGWLLVATAAAGFFSIGYGCSQQLMFKNTILNEIIGEICLIPLMYPFASWRLRLFDYSEANGYITGLLKGRFWWLSSVWDWLLSAFHWSRNPRVIASFVCLYTFASIFFPLLAYNLGVWGLFKYYFIPFAIYHFWLSTVLKLKYGLPNVVNLRRIPECFEFLSNDISYVLNSVTELSAQIPSYNLREAYCFIQDWYEKQTDVYTMVNEYEIVIRSGDKLIHLNKKTVWKKKEKGGEGEKEETKGKEREREGEGERASPLPPCQDQLAHHSLPRPYPSPLSRWLVLPLSFLENLSPQFRLLQSGRHFHHCWVPSIVLASSV
jgi:hypothetical protein